MTSSIVVSQKSVPSPTKPAPVFHRSQVKVYAERTVQLSLRQLAGEFEDIVARDM